MSKACACLDTADAVLQTCMPQADFQPASFAMPHQARLSCTADFCDAQGVVALPQISKCHEVTQISFTEPDAFQMCDLHHHQVAAWQLFCSDCHATPRCCRQGLAEAPQGLKKLFKHWESAYLSKPKGLSMSTTNLDACCRQQEWIDTKKIKGEDPPEGPAF